MGDFEIAGYDKFILEQMTATDEQVEEICNLLINTELSYQEIGNMFSVEKSTINNIKNHKNWKYITSKYDFSCREVIRDELGRFRQINTNIHKL